MEQDILLLQNILNTLKEQPDASQRQLAQNANVSLGMMNAILGRFVERGWVMLSNVNARKLAYALTQKGLKELSNRSKRFAKRTFALANEYNQLLSDLIKNEKSKGKDTVVLYGNSYIKFILEYVCNREGIRFVQEDTKTLEIISKNILPVVGELVADEEQNRLINAGCVSLLDLMEEK